MQSGSIIMYKRILVPVDGSEASNAGLSEALRLAKSAGGSVQLFHVVNEVILVSGAGAAAPAAYYGDLVESLRREGKEALDKAQTLVRDAGLKAESVLVESVGGTTADMIIEQAKKWPADLIVMGTHGRRGLRRLAMGSDAEQVVRATLVPVLLVRGQPAKD